MHRQIETLNKYDWMLLIGFALAFAAASTMHIPTIIKLGVPGIVLMILGAHGRR